jgi:hypothetical protein
VLRKSVAFLKDIIRKHPKFSYNVNNELKDLYCICLARAASALTAVDTESLMEEDFEICLKSDKKEDYSLFMIEAFWESEVESKDNGNFIKMSGAYLGLFKNQYYTSKVSPKLLEHFFNHSKISNSDKQEGFNLLYCKDTFNIAENLIIFLKQVFFTEGTLTRLPLPDFLKNFKDFRTQETKDALSRFLESKEIKAIDENMIYFLLESPLPQVKKYLEESDHYYPMLIKQIRAYLAKLEESVKIGHLTQPQIFTDKKIELIEMVMKKKTPEGNFRQMITDLMALVQVELKNLETVERVMESNTDALNKFQFYEINWKELQTLKTTTLFSLTLKQLVTTPIYLNTKMMLDEAFWLRNRLLMNYKLFKAEVANQTKADLSLPDYYSIIKKTSDKLKAMFEPFANPSKFTLQDYDTYFPRIAFKENSDIYWSFLHGLEIKEEDQTKIIRSCIMFHSVNKIKKIKDPMIELMKIVEAKEDEFSKAIIETANVFAPLAANKVTVQTITEKDSHKIITVDNLDESLTYRMPMVLKVVAKCPKVLGFIKKHPDEFLKAMREEVDEDNLELMNMLDIINKNMKFIVDEPNITFKEIVKRSCLIHKFDQRRLKDFLQKVEPQVEKTLDFLAEKTKKDSNYNKRIIESMLKSSEIYIHFENKFKRFVVEVYYKEKDNLVLLKPFEFDELLNKAKIIAAEANARDEEENRDFTYVMQNFCQFGSQLEQISLAFGKLKDLGIIHTRISDLIPCMNQMCSSKNFFSVEGQGKKLFFKYSNNGNDSQNLNDLISSSTRLQKLYDKLKKELDEAYNPDCYLLTLFHGKRLFYLIELLRGKDREDNLDENFSIEPAQIYEMVTSFVPEEKVNFEIVKLLESDNINPDNIIADVRTNMTSWSEMIKYTDTVVEPQTKVFTSRKIKLCTSSGNPYKTMFKILCNANQPMVCLSHILLCTRDTTKEELLSFCRRAFLDPFKKIYFFLGAERLQFEQIVYFKKILLELQQSRNSLNKNLLIFTSKSNLFESDEFEVIDQLIHALEEKEVQDQEIFTAFSTFNTTKIVMSDQAGMGKTTTIKNLWNNQGQMFEIFFCGEMSRNAIKHRLNNLALDVKLSTSPDETNFGLTIKLDYIEDFDTNAPILDYLIFCICMIRCFYTDQGCFNFDTKAGGSFLEISNSFKLELMSSLDFIKLFSELRTNESQMSIINTPPFSFDNLHFSEVENSNEQVVGKFLAELSELAENQDDGVDFKKRTITMTQFQSLVKTYFLKDYLGGNKKEEERLQTTYSQYQFWLQTLASLARDMNDIKDFSIASIVEEDDDDNEENLKKLKNLREQVMKELLQFCTYVINVSVSQAKSSQDEMKKMMIEIKADRSKLSEIMSRYADKFTNIIPWNSNSLIVPLFGNNLAFFAMKRLENIFNNAKILDVFENPSSTKEATQLANLRAGKRKELRDYIKQTEMYLKFEKGMTDHSGQCMSIYAKFLGENEAALKERASQFKENKGFVFTFENFMKISLIILKAKLKIPIVMMGESGCGKTYLTQFISECLLQDEMKELTLYSGVTEKDFIRFMNEACNVARNQEEGRRVWVFFDEFNTSPLQSLVAEIMIDRVCSADRSISNIPENMVFIGCCNPFRMKTKKTEVGLVPKTSDTILSHRVYPIPERLLNYVWDFGQLSEADEKKHIESMVKAEKIFTDEDVTKRTKFINLAYSSHSTVRDIEERSGVSLRDVKRVLKLYSWFKKTIEHLNNNCNANIFKGEEWVRAAICSVYTAYGLRLNGRAEAQDKLLNAITEVVKGETSKGITKSDVKGTLPSIAQYYLDKLKKVTNSIPDNIAINRPLKENFITMLACYDAKIPLIICGAPGTSKTLCSQIFDSAMITSLIRSEREFEPFKAIHSLYYGGSQTSTAEGISKVFDRADNYLKQHGEDRPVVVFDEIGLAELSPYNPLKVLHPLLEKPNQEVGFFGISNWTLDLSKMNRLIYLARPDMGEDDLKEIFDISVRACGDSSGKFSETQKLLKSYLDNLAKAYLEFRLWQKKTGEVYMIHPNFHGSRDIYGVSKFLYNSVVKGRFKTDKDIPALLKNAIERNFNGAAYHFGEHQGGLPLSLVPGLSDKAKASSSFSNIRLQDIGSPYDNERKQIPQNLIILSSSQVFKQIFLNTIKAAASSFGSDFFNETPVLEQVAANILDQQARFLLIKSEGEVVDNLFMELLKTIMSYRDKDIPIKDWRGIKGKENSIELLTTLKNYISLGYIVVMKNLDDLYGSLYDLFNQKYAEVDGRLYCYLYFGENKHKVEVHPNFKAIILVEQEKELKGRELELEQPAPFLNRFEKFFVRMSNLLPEEDMKFIYGLVGYLHTIINGKPFRIIGMSIDMIASIHKKARELGQKDQAKVKEFIIRLIFRMATSHFLLRSGLTESDLKIFKEEHPYKDLNSAIVAVNKKSSYKVCIYTMSNPIEIEGFTRKWFDEDESNVFLTSEQMLRLGLEARAEKLKKMHANLLLLQFTQKDHLDLISQLKSSVNENKNIKRVIFLVHVDRRAAEAAKLNGNIGLNYWDDWDNYVIEDIGGVEYEEYSNLYSYSIRNMLFVTRKFDLSVKIMKEVAVATLQKIIMETNDVTLTSNFQSIKEMFIFDEVFAYGMVVQLSDIVDNEQSWRALIVQRLGSNVNYIDLDSALLAVISDPKNGIIDLCKKFMLKMNEKLTNLASYAIHYKDENPIVQDTYRQNFKEKIISKVTRSEVLSAVYTKEHYRVPFLALSYVKFFDKLSVDLTANLKAEYTNLSENYRIYLNIRSSLQDKSDEGTIKGIQDKLVRLEAFIFKNFNENHLESLFGSSDEIATLIKTEATLREELITDLVFGMLLTLEKMGSASKKDHGADNFINQLQSKFPLFP